MNKALYVFFIGFLILDCSKQKEAKNEKLEAYIISKSDRELEEDLKKTGKIVLVNTGFYYNNQIIIDKKSNIFYLQKSFSQSTSDVLCGTNWKEETIPYFINLSPKNIIKIPKNGLDNLLKNSKNKKFIMIASQSDTIKNTEFLDFYKTIKSLSYKIRRTTQEEDTVLHYKKTNKPYYPDSIKWDKSKIKFQEK